MIEISLRHAKQRIVDRLRVTEVSNSSESDCAYPFVILVSYRWRVIECRHRLQWILQYRNRAETVATDVWRGRSFCRTREALIRSCDHHVGRIDAKARAVLGRLPEQIDRHPMPYS